MEALVYLPAGEVVEMLTLRESGVVRYSAWEPAGGVSDHATLTTFRGRLYGRVANRVQGDAAAHREQAHALIRQAFPDAVRALPDGAEPGDLCADPAAVVAAARARATTARRGRRPRPRV